MDAILKDKLRTDYIRNVRGRITLKAARGMLGMIEGWRTGRYYGEP